MTIVVCGSINMDLVAQTPRLPAPGETIVGRQFITAPGGKGANQAVTAARLQAPTKMVGRVGDDQFGEALRHQLNQADAVRAGQLLLQRGVKTVIIKLGALGVFYTSQVEPTANDGLHVPAFEVETVDTVAAGDAFNGALAVALTEGQPISGATRFAVAVAALSTTQAGAQTAMPSRVEVEKFLRLKTI